MYPNHCREVGIKKVDFTLNEEEIQRRLKGTRLYTATKYIILNNGNDWAVCRISKSDGFELFRDVEEVEVLSTPENTLYTEDPDVDVMNPSKLVAKYMEAASGNGIKTVVVKGEFDHISFAHDECLKELIVFETVPPNPPKLVTLVERAVSFGRVSVPLKINNEYIKIDEIAAETEADTIVFPCKTSDLQAEKKKILYLDQLPDLEAMEGKVVLIGCSLSDRIFKSHYHRKPELLNICPSDLVEKIESGSNGAPVILKCCKLKDHFEIENNLIKVPWGTTVRIIEDALNEYFSKKDSSNNGGV